MKVKKKILWVEDEPGRLDIYRRETFPEEKYEVQFVKNLNLENFSCNYYLVIIDVLLPDVNKHNAGIEFISEIRRRCDDVPILVFSGASDYAIKNKCIENGANKFIEKYPPIKDFIIEVNKLLNEIK